MIGQSGCSLSKVCFVRFDKRWVIESEPERIVPIRAHKVIACDILRDTCDVVTKPKSGTFANSFETRTATTRYTSSFVKEFWLAVPGTNYHHMKTLRIVTWNHAMPCREIPTTVFLVRGSVLFMVSGRRESAYLLQVKTNVSRGLTENHLL